jgi:cob(I)alamin adenosyltransferase
LSSGIVQVYFGAGKGKTTAAAGLCLRALHYGFKVRFFQFLKTAEWRSGEIAGLSGFGNFKSSLSRYSHPVFYPADRRPTPGAVRADQKRLAAAAARAIRSATGVVVLDEVLNALSGGFIGRKDLEAVLGARPSSVELVLTGRDLPAWLRPKARLITEFRDVRHPFRSGLGARKGIEF